jgi:phytoene dehydrogenase-like protein
MVSFDGIVIGGGHNGLTCAAYLARAGLRIAVVERNPDIGGGCTTADVTLPGFRHNLHATYHFFADSPVYRDLELERYGLRYIYPEVQHGMVFRDGRAVTVHRDAERTAASFARFSKRDGDAYLTLYQRYAVELAEMMNQYVYSRPAQDLELLERVRPPVFNEMYHFVSISLYEAVDELFEDEHIRLMFKTMLHTSGMENLPNMGLAMPRILSIAGRTGLAEGGSASLPRALAAVLGEHGCVIHTDAHVEQILVDDDVVRGVRLTSGEVLEATRFVASGVDAPQTVRLAGEEHFDKEIVESIRGFEWATHSLVTIHLALNEPPRYAAADFDPAIDHAYDTLLGPDSTADIEAAFAAIRRGDLPTRMVGSGSALTRFDRSLAPEGKHTAFWWALAPYDLRDGGPAAWDACKAEITERMLAEWRQFAPNLTPENVLGTYLFTPLDIERSCINMVRGSHHVGRYTVEQFGFNRPIPEMAYYRTPIDGLYLCGASSHPGGSVTGGPGYNCANAILTDLNVPLWWTPMPLPSWEPGKAAARAGA